MEFSTAFLPRSRYRVQDSQVANRCNQNRTAPAPDKLRFRGASAGLFIYTLRILLVVVKEYHPEPLSRLYQGMADDS